MGAYDSLQRLCEGLKKQLIKNIGFKDQVEVDFGFRLVRSLFELMHTASTMTNTKLEFAWRTAYVAGANWLQRALNGFGPNWTAAG